MARHGDISRSPDLSIDDEVMKLHDSRSIEYVLDNSTKRPSDDAAHGDD